MSGKQNLVMGFWARQPFRPLERFVASLRHIGFAGDVCLCVEEISADTVALLRAHGIIVERAGLSAQSRLPAPASRYFNYLDFLTRHGDAYAKVMLIDPDATVFQSDPFAALLPAEVVYTQERCRVAESVSVHDAVVQAYGESVAHNVRDCMVSSTNATLGTTSGILRYLAAMTNELSGRLMPVTAAIDQAVHNYVVHMRPLGNAWLDPDSAIAAVPHHFEDASVRIADQGVLIDGRLAPVLSQWDSHARTREHVRSAAQFRLSEPAPRAAAGADDAVVAYYHRERDGQWLSLFLGSLRCVNASVSVHCVGDFDQNERALLSQHGCVTHPVPPAETSIAENVAHFYLSQVLDRLAAGRPTQPGHVLVLDSVRAMFPRDPFLNKTIGLSVFCEGPSRLGETGYNRDRLAFFVTPDEQRLQCPVVSSALLRGSLPVVREFYRQVLAELVGRAELLSIHKVIQGAFNKLCRDRSPGFPVIAHPNGAEVYFDFWPSGLAIDTRHGVRIGGTVPGVVLGWHTETELMMKLRIDLNLAVQ